MDTHYQSIFQPSEYQMIFHTDLSGVNHTQRQIKSLMKPSHNPLVDLPQKIYVFNELGTTTIRSYVRTKITIFDQIMRFLSSMEYTTGIIPSYLTQDFVNERNINWLIQNDCFYKMYDNMSLFDILCVTYVFSNPLHFRMYTCILNSSSEYINDVLRSLNTEILVSIRQFYRNCGYWTCLLDTVSSIYRPDAGSIDDYTAEEQDKIHDILDKNMAFYVDLLHTLFSYENDVFEWLVETSVQNHTRSLSKRITDRIQLTTVFHLTIRKMVSPSIFTQAISWMVGRWLKHGQLDDPYIGDMSTQIKAVTNYFQYVHIFNKANVRVSSIQTDENTHILKESEHVKYVIPYEPIYDEYTGNSRLLQFILNPTGPIHIQMRVQFMTAIPDHTWVYILQQNASDISGFVEPFYLCLLKNYILIENFNEHNGFQQQMEFRNSILDILSTKMWMRQLYTKYPKIGFEFITLVTSHMIKLIDTCSEYIQELRSYMTSISEHNMPKLEMIRLYNNIDETAESIVTIIQCVSELMLYEHVDDEKANYSRWWYRGLSDFIISFMCSFNKAIRTLFWYDQRLLLFRNYRELMMRVNDSVYTCIENFTRCCRKNTDHAIIHPDMEEWIGILSEYMEYNNRVYKSPTRTVNNQQYDEELVFDSPGFRVDADTVIHDAFQDTIDELTGFMKEKTVNYKDSVPSEFMDPILFYEMDYPMELPDTKIMVDEWSILKHVIIEKNNPYTRKPLNLDVLFEYQQLPEVAERVKDVSDRFTQWKTANRME